MKSTICTLAALLLSLMLFGCGQSGPLYVPGDPSSIKTPPEVESSDEEGETNGEEGEENDRR